MRRNEYHDNLRTIIQHSADVLPKQVAAFLEQTARSRSGNGIGIFLREHQQLCRHLAKEYVDAMLLYLLPSEEDRYDQNARMLFKCGLRNDLNFFPASPVKPPFLALLNACEDEGLRLIGALSDQSVMWWRNSYSHPVKALGETKLHPVPTRLRIENIEQEFWGDEQVYRWFRPFNGGNDAVTSALMALELWMEQRLEAGRSPHELFEKVLSSGKCIALAGVCLSVALAYPEPCLSAAFPIITSSAVWKMDNVRFKCDQYDNKMPDSSGQYKLLATFQEERNQRPQRKRDIRNLAGLCLFGDDAPLRELFEVSLNHFSDNLPFDFEEDKEDAECVNALKEQVEEMQVWASRDTIKLYQSEGYLYYQPVFPAHIKARHENKIAAANAEFQQIQLDFWTNESLKTEQAAEGLNVEAAWELARALGRVDEIECLSSPPESFTNKDFLRLRILIKTAATIAVITQYPLRGEMLDWCSQVLLSASRIQAPDSYFSHYISDSRWEIKSCAARGIAALSIHEGANIELKRQVLKQAVDVAVTGGVFSGLHPGWQSESVLCWNALSLALTVCLKPRQNQRQSWEEPWEVAQARYEQEVRNSIEIETARHLKNFDEGVIPDLPQVPLDDSVTFLWDIAPQALGWLPVDILLQEEVTKARILKLTDNLVAWTVYANSPGPADRYGHASYRHTGNAWNSFFQNWLMTLTKNLTLSEIRQHTIMPLLSSLEIAPSLLADFLMHFLFNHLAFEDPPAADSMTLWNETHQAILERSKQKLLSQTIYGSSYLDELLGILIFTRFGGTLVTKQWRHAHLFTAGIDQWVETVRVDADRYNEMLILLSDHAENFGVNTALAWLTRMTGQVDDGFWLQHENGRRTGELLAHLWQVGATQISKDTGLLSAYSGLVDRLVIIGVPVANILQQRLEGRPKQ